MHKTTKVSTKTVYFNYFPVLKHGNVIDDDCCGHFLVNSCCICMIDTFCARIVAILIAIEPNDPLIFFDLK